MDNLVYKNELESAFNFWLKRYGFSEEVALATDFAYDEINDKIYFGFFIPCNAEEVWNKLIAKWGLKVNYGTFCTCFLHELGHAKTLDEFYGVEYVLNNLAKKILQFIPNPKIRNYLYFNLPIEKKATQWAIDYMNTCPYACKTLQEIAKREINAFMEANEVIDF